MFLNDNQLNLLKSIFSEYPVIKAYVFGSFARGDANESSDVDLLIDLDYVNLHSGMEFVSLKFDIEERLGRNVDLLTTKSVSKYIESFVNADKKLIYERH